MNIKNLRFLPLITHLAILQVNGKFDKIISICLKKIRKKPSHSVCLYFLVLTYGELKQFKMQQKYIEQIIFYKKHSDKIISNYIFTGFKHLYETKEYNYVIKIGEQLLLNTDDITSIILINRTLCNANYMLGYISKAKHNLSIIKEHNRAEDQDFLSSFHDLI